MTRRTSGRQPSRLTRATEVDTKGLLRRPKTSDKWEIGSWFALILRQRLLRFAVLVQQVGHTLTGDAEDPGNLSGGHALRMQLPRSRTPETRRGCVEAF